MSDRTTPPRGSSPRPSGGFYAKTRSDPDRVHNAVIALGLLAVLGYGLYALIPEGPESDAAPAHAATQSAPKAPSTLDEKIQRFKKGESQRSLEEKIRDLRAENQRLRDLIVSKGLTGPVENPVLLRLRAENVTLREELEYRRRSLEASIDQRQ